MLLLTLLLQAVPDTASAVRSALATVPPAERVVLDSVYRETGGRFLWHAGAAITARGIALRNEFETAPDRGLAFNGYLPDLGNGAALDAIARRDVQLSQLALRLARDLARGRIAPARLDSTSRLVGRPFDPVATLLALGGSAEPARIFDALEPRDSAYWALRRALPALREAARNDAPWPTAGFPRLLRPGDSGAAVARLRDRLHQLGDHPLDASSERFDSALAEALVRFQHRHGLAADTVVGPATRAALATPLSWRVRQVELTLERWRWYADPGEAPLIEVDVPGASVHLRDSLLGTERFGARVVVGTSETPTPLLESVVSRVVFNPPWVVPAKIARTELRPQFEADPSAIAAGNYELLRGGAVVPATPGNVAALGRGVTVRQRPGPANALGRIKLEVAGTSAIHLHDTPTRRLFERDTRTFSHGCIRVERPAEIAALLLGAEWDATRIAGVTRDTLTVTVPLPRPVAIRLMYATAVVEPDGRVGFRPDPYARDRKLDAALRRLP